MSFTGEYINLIDQKNRISIPSKFRNALGSINERTFVITKGFDECLFLYPLEEWRIVEKQLSSLSTMVLCLSTRTSCSPLFVVTSPSP